MAGIRVLIVDDHALFRAGLRLLVEAQADMTVVGEAGDGREAVRVAAAAAPDVVTLDVTMPGGGGLAAGGAGYVLKTAEESELLAAIRVVHRGHTFVHAGLTPEAC